MSRKERKSYNQGKRDGYLEGYAIGYAQGLIDGDPFKRFAELFGEAIRKACDNIPEVLNDPKLYDAIAEQLEKEHQDPVCHCTPIESKDIDWDELGGDES